MDKKKGIILYAVVMSMLLFVFFIIGVNQYKTRLSYNNRIEELHRQIAEVSKKTEELNAQSKYKESDEYLEKLAREQLGMVKPNEIIYIDRNKN